MMRTQLSVFLVNTSKHLTECLRILAENNVKITAMTLVNNVDSKVLHFIANDPIKASKLLKRNGLGVGETDVMLVELPDKTKALEDFLNIIKENSSIQIEYMYMGGNCQFIFRFKDLDRL